MSVFRHFGIVALCAAGCSVGGPAIDPIEDQVVAVGDDVLIEVHASSPEGRDLAYSFTSNNPRLGDRATIAPRPDGSGGLR